MENLVKYEVLALFGIVIFCLALPYIYEFFLSIKNFIDDLNDNHEDKFGI